MVESQSHKHLPSPIGECLIRQGVISRWQLKQALNKQKHSKKKRIGEILLELGVLDTHKLKEALQVHFAMTSPSSKRNDTCLGQILIRSQLLTKEKLSQLLYQQKQTQKPLGELLIENGILTSCELEELLSIQFLIAVGHEPPKLGHLMMFQKLLSSFQLQVALKLQKIIGKPLGEVLLQLNWVSVKDLKQVLRVQKRLNSGILLSGFGFLVLSACSPPQVPLQPFGQNQVLSIQGLSSSPTNFLSPQLGGPSKQLRLKNNKNLIVYKNGAKVLDNVPFSLQGNDNTCGQAVLTMLLNYWGIQANYQDIVNKTNAWNLATTSGAIREYLRQKGLSAQDYSRASFRDLIQQVNQGYPAVVLLDFGGLSQAHYVIVVGYNLKSSTVVLHDSLEGPYVEMPIPLFQRMWQNKAIRNLPLPGMSNYDRLMFSVFNPNGQYT